MSRRPFVLVISACALLLAACSSGFQVLIPADSTSDNLAFEFADHDGGRLRVAASSIGVYKCASIHERANGNFFPPPSEAVWFARVTTLDDAKTTERIVYGRDEHGLATAHGPAALEPYECYVVHINGSAANGKGRGGTAGFTVASDRTVVQMTEAESGKIFGN